MPERGVLARRETAILLAAFLVLFVAGGARFAIGLTLKPMAEELGWSRTTFGLAVAAFLVVSASCMFVAGRLSDRFSMRLVLGGGLVLCGIGIAAMSSIAEPWHAYLLYGGVFAIGSGIASLAPIGVLVSRWFPRRTGLANAAATAGLGVGQLVMIAALAAVLVSLGWRSVYVWLGVAHLVVIPFVIAAVRDERRHAPTSSGPARPGASFGEALRSRHFWLLALIYAICGAQDFFVATHVVAFAQDRGVGDLLAGNLLAFMGLTGLVGVLAAGAWSDSAGPVRATLACFVVRIAVFSLIVTEQGTVSVALFALLFGLTFWMTAPLTIIFVRERFGLLHLGALSGLVQMIHHMGGGLGAYAGAALFDTQGRYDTAFAAMLGLSVVALVLTWWLRPRPRGASEPSPP